MFKIDPEGNERDSIPFFRAAVAKEGRGMGDVSVPSKSRTGAGTGTGTGFFLPFVGIGTGSGRELEGFTAENADAGVDLLFDKDLV